ncbi:MAG: sigma-70 family RNA polymerase sigma factor [Vicinamibacterales bacterium]
MRDLWTFVLLRTASARFALAAADAGQGDDAALMARVVARDADAFAELYDRHARAVFSLAFRIVGDQLEAEDVVQDVFTQAWRQAERYDARRGALPAWLLNITRSRAIDLLRRRRQRVAAPPGFWSELVAAGPAPDTLALTSARVQALKQALADLPWAQRLPIELAYFEGLSQSEIAVRLEEPVGTIKTRVRLGLMKLRDAVAGGRR